MAQNSFFPSTLFARLISVHPDKQDIDFPCNPESDQANPEWRISQKSSGEIFLKNISVPNLQVDDRLLEIGQEKRLFGGERMSFDQDSGLKFDYVFCPMNFRSDLKRDRDDEIVDSEKMKKLVKIENDLPKELTCSICTNFLQKCMILVPFQHVFCSFCLFDHLKLSSQCPLCRTEAVSVAKNSVLSDVIQLIADNLPPLQKSQEGKELKQINFGGMIVRNKQGVYIGSCVNGKRHGQGKMISKSGSIYEGDWKNGRCEGKGTIVYYNGDRYDGFLMNYQKHGAGKYLWTDGREFEGNYENDVRNGYGIMKYVNGGIYQGDWKNLDREGKGVMAFANGDKCEGKWANDVLQPEVKIEYSNGEKYEGEINVGNLQKEGKGVLVLKTGDKYQGSWVRDSLQSEVTIEYSNGEKYEGEINVENLQKQGKGILALNNGDKYKGTWVNNVLQPKVMIEYSNGDKYEGEIGAKDFKKQGKGVLISSDGDKYEGNWVNDKQHGHGKTIWKKNKFMYEGLWEEGKFIGDGIITYGDGTRFKLEKL